MSNTNSYQFEENRESRAKALKLAAIQRKRDKGKKLVKVDAHTWIIPRSKTMTAAEKKADAEMAAEIKRLLRSNGKRITEGDNFDESLLSGVIEPKRKKNGSK